MPLAPSGSLLAINEWLFSDLFGENGNEKQIKSQKFLLALIENPDRIVFPKPSPWAEKAYVLSKQANMDMACKNASRLLFGRILMDSAKARATNPDSAPPLDPGVASRIPEEDHYLVRAALAANADLLVTTDQALLEGVNQSGFPFGAIHRDEFLEKYLRKGASGGLEKSAP